MSSLITRVRKAVLSNAFRRDQTHGVETLASKAADVDRRRQGLSEYEPEFSSLNVHDGTDGAWWCVRCGFQNSLKVQNGRHPFSRLACGECDHVLNRKDVSTNVLCEQVKTDKFHPDWFQGEEGRACGVVCPGCGSRHLGARLPMQDVPGSYTWAFGHVECHCGCQGGGRWHRGWYRFCVGSCRDWHEDRLGAEGRATQERLERRFQAM